VKGTQIKNILICALVAVNVFFLGFWLVGRAADFGKKIEIRNDLRTLLEQNGVKMDIRVIHEGGELYTLESFRNTAREQELAKALLGNDVVAGQDGSKASYAGVNGQAVFGIGGEFQVKLSGGVVKDAPGVENAVRQLLRTMQIDAETDTVSGSAGNETVTAVGTWNKTKIFNYRIRFVFKNGSLSEINGAYAPDIRPTAVKTDMSSCATALLTFLGDVRQGKNNSTEIRDVRPGYRLTVSVGKLDPVWRIVTDAGVFYVNALDGSVEPASE
jgi:hypothetical protein